MLTIFLTTLSVIWLILALLSSLAAEQERRNYLAQGYDDTPRKIHWWYWPATLLAATWIIASVVGMFL